MTADVYYSQLMSPSFIVTFSDIYFYLIFSFKLVSFHFTNIFVTMESKEITTIFFDLDNTLIPTRKGDSKAIKKVSKFFSKKNLRGSNFFVFPIRSPFFTAFN
jgi:hypothetical protein